MLGRLVQVFWCIDLIDLLGAFESIVRFELGAIKQTKL